MPYKLINKKTKEVERISNDRIFYDDTKYDLIEFNPDDTRKDINKKIDKANNIKDIKDILKDIVKEII